MNAAVNAFFLILKLLSLYFLVVSLFSLCNAKCKNPPLRKGGLQC